MKTVEEIKSMFKPKTRAGNEYVILDVLDNEIAAAVEIGRKWQILYYEINGKAINYSIYNGLDLIPIKPKIDYSKLPKDVLCLVRYMGNDILRYSNGEGGFYAKGSDSFSKKHKGAYFSEVVMIVDNPERVNYENQIEFIPDNVRVRVEVFDTVFFHKRCGLVQEVRDNLDEGETIIWYQILAED